jgi:HAD superfamily hydrolase (TIGR01509 family)
MPPASRSFVGGRGGRPMAEDGATGEELPVDAAPGVPLVEMVFFDIGGVMYDDTVYARSWMRALRESGGEFSDEEFDREYAAARAEQSGSFRRRLTRRFLGTAADLDAVEARAARYWAYPPTALFLDVIACLEALEGRYRLGVIANQPTSVRAAMERDGLARFFEVWGVSDDLGLQKPDPELFSHVLATASVSPNRTVMVGDRLDYDMRPAKAAGMRVIWVLRGEAPDDPTPEQLAETDGAVRTLAELPVMLESWGRPAGS